MIKSVFGEAMAQGDLHSALANQEFVRLGLARFRPAREFQRVFPNAEHKVIHADHDFGPPDYWRTVYDWLSRARLHDRYIAMLSVAIDIAQDGQIDQLKPPELHVFEVVRVIKGRREKGGPKWELRWGDLDNVAWRKLVKTSGDFASLGIKLVTNRPAPRFETYWRDTQPGWISCPSLKVTVVPKTRRRAQVGRIGRPKRKHR